MKFCDECGATLEDDVWFCDECGANIEKPSETKKDDNKIADKNSIENTSSRCKKRNYKNIILVIISMIIVSISSVVVALAITNKDNKDDNTKVASLESEKKVEKEAEEITTEEVTTVEETTTEVIDYKKYISILSEIQNNYNSYNSYTIHDLNNDGICELLVESGQISSSYEWSVYSIYNNNVIFVDNFIAIDTLFYDGEDGSIVLQSTRMGYETIKKLTYDGKIINEEKIIEREISADEEYLSFDKALKMYYITDYSLIP